MKIVAKPFWVFVLVAGFVAKAWAGGPRFVTGTTYSYQPAPPGQVMSFYTNTPGYFTDPGDLAANVSHAQADAMVAAAAAVWNVPQSSLSLKQGGVLAEHVSSANAYFDGTDVVFPADVQATNYLAIPIAVIYDTDGSVTDLLLGEGASDPASCRQNGVTSSVDSLGPYTATINHAVMVLNGRCVGTNAQQLMQMQYQVMRAFGRVLGLAWSQCNDNVFTGTPTPTMAQMQHWPVMHPIDILCGPYTYQCMQSAFTLRPDDVAALALLYPTVSIYPNPGQAIGLTDGVYMRGYVTFPTGQGMEDVNVTVTRAPSTYQTVEGWQEVSAVSGATFQQNGGNPITGAEPASENMGLNFAQNEEAFDIGYIPIVAPWTSLLVTTESINPLYTGAYAVGPYERPPLAMSGGAQTFAISFGVPGYVDGAWLTMGGASSCATGNDGMPSAPTAADPSGWWSGLLCPTGHSSWWSATVKANHSWTMEVTALDEGGHATTEKMQPVLGAWTGGALVASQGGAMNAMALGVTQMQVPAATSDATYTMGIADQFGAGRPDFAYQARVLYADSVAPAVVDAGGGVIVVTGTGFRTGNEVLVNGVVARGLTWSATQIVAEAPTMAAAGAGAGAVDVEVLDPQTGAVTDIGEALTYQVSSVGVGPPAQITVLTGAGQSVSVGTALQPLLMQVLDSNGNPVPGVSVTVHQTDYAWEGVCAAQGPCPSAPVLATQTTTVVSDGSGVLQVVPLVTGSQPQTVEVAASAGTTGFVSVGLVVKP
jgi:hypothetical protein